MNLQIWWTMWLVKESWLRKKGMKRFVKKISKTDSNGVLAYTLGASLATSEKKSAKIVKFLKKGEV